MEQSWLEYWSTLQGGPDDDLSTQQPRRRG
jgi:hypothetical protein